jgi:hypothetical protein
MPLLCGPRLWCRQRRRHFHAGGLLGRALHVYTLALLASGEGKTRRSPSLEPVVQAFEVTGVHQATDAKTQTIRNRINRRHQEGRALCGPWPRAP